MNFQAGGALIELCVLSVLQHEDLYGYRLTEKIAVPLGLSESTLYPVLRRLNKNGCLDVYDQSHGGRNRRYYRLTEKGLNYLNELQQQWLVFLKTIASLTGKDDHHD